MPIVTALYQVRDGKSVVCEFTKLHIAQNYIKIMKIEWNLDLTLNILN